MSGVTPPAERVSLSPTLTEAVAMRKYWPFFREIPASRGFAGGGCAQNHGLALSRKTAATPRQRRQSGDSQSTASGA